MTNWQGDRRPVGEHLTPEEFQRLLDATHTEEHYLLLRVLWETGGRVSEVNRLTRENLDAVGNAIILTNLKQHRRHDTTLPKQPAPLKRVYLFPESDLVARLSDYCNQLKLKDDAFIFPSRRNPDKPMTRLYVWLLITSLAKACSIRHIKKDMMSGEYRNKPAWTHLFRHGMAVATLHRVGRLDVVRDQLGHAAISSTEVYAGLSDADRREIIQGSHN